MVHCEDGALPAAAVRNLTRAGQTSLEHYAQSRPVVAEAWRRPLSWAAALCESTGAPMYVVHLSSARALDACKAARALELPFFVETRPLYLHLTEEKLAGPDGPLYVGQPPLRTRGDSEALWQGAGRGRHRRARHGSRALDPGAEDGSEPLDQPGPARGQRSPVHAADVLLRGVGKRGISLERFVATTSTNAARIFGLYPEKGVVREQSSADVVVWDPLRTRVVRAEDDFSRSDYSPYEGWEVTGWPTITIRRGEVVYEEGRMIGTAGSGRLMAREPWRR